MLTLRDRATAVTLEDAVRHFREELPPTTGASPAGVARTAEGVSSSSSASAGSVAPVAGAPATSSTTTAGDLRPPGGVYRYRTSGGEEVPFINAARSYPTETTATVLRAASGCSWHLRVDLLAEHRDDYEMCTTAAAVTIPAFNITIEWFFIRRSITLLCSSPIRLLVHGSTPGEERTTTCAGDDIRTTMRVVERGIAALTVASTTMQAARVDLRMDIGGQFEGGADYQMWLHPQSGLLLRLVRAVDAKGDSPLGRQRYVEHHDTVLLDPTPVT